MFFGFCGPTHPVWGALRAAEGLSACVGSTNSLVFGWGQAPRSACVFHCAEAAWASFFCRQGGGGQVCLSPVDWRSGARWTGLPAQWLPLVAVVRPSPAVSLVLGITQKARAHQGGRLSSSYMEIALMLSWGLPPTAAPDCGLSCSLAECTGLLPCRLCHFYLARCDCCSRASPWGVCGVPDFCACYWPNWCLALSLVL